MHVFCPGCSETIYQDWMQLFEAYGWRGTGHRLQELAWSLVANDVLCCDHLANLEVAFGMFTSCWGGRSFMQFVVTLCSCAGCVLVEICVLHGMCVLHMIDETVVKLCSVCEGS